MSQGYNGWTNRETWLVNVWFTPESREDVENARLLLEEQYDQLPDCPLKERFALVAVTEVDWDQLLDHLAESADSE